MLSFPKKGTIAVRARGSRDELY